MEMVLPKTHLSQRVELLLLVALRRRGLSLRRVMPRGCQMRVRGRRDARQHVQYAAERTRRGASLYVAAATGRVLLVGRADRARADSAPSPQPLPTAVDIPFWCPSHKRARRWRPQGPPPKEHSTQKVPLRSSFPTAQPLSLPHPRNLFLQLVLARTLSTALAPLPHPLPAEMAAPAPPLATPRAWSALPAGGQGAPAARGFFFLHCLPPFPPAGIAPLRGATTTLAPCFHPP